MTIKTIQSNELKKGTEIVLKNGWKATIEDNKKGNIRMAMVHGFCSEMGSIYVHDIGYAIVNGERHLIELTDSQKKCKAMVDNMF